MRVFRNFRIALLLFASFLCTSLVYGDIVEDLDDLEPKKKTEKKTPPPAKLPEVVEPTSDEVKPKPSSTKKPTSTKSNNNKKQRASKSREPVKFKGDGQSTYSSIKGVMTIQDNVVITQGDLRLQADEAVVTFYKEKAEKDDVKEVEIIGSVKVSKFDQNPAERMVAHGDKAVFYNAQQKVKLIGNARLYRGGDLMKGKQITYDIQTGMVIVDQAQGVVQPEESD